MNAMAGGILVRKMLSLTKHVILLIPPIRRFTCMSLTAFRKALLPVHFPLFSWKFRIASFAMLNEMPKFLGRCARRAWK